MNNEINDLNKQKESKNNGNWIIIAILIIIIIALVGYMVYDKIIVNKNTSNNVINSESNNETNNNANESNKNNQQPSIESNSEIDNSNDLVIYNDKYLAPDEFYKVSLRYSKDNNLAILLINDKEYLDNIAEYFVVNNGGDICAGNEHIVFLLNDGTISGLNVDDMICGNKITIENNISSLKNVVNVYKSLVSCNENEPCFYNVFAQTKDGTSIQIFK